MPPLKVCGVSMFFADDDSDVIAIGSILLRTIQIGFLIPCFLLLLQSKNHDTTTEDAEFMNSDPHNNNNKLIRRKEYATMYTFWSLSLASAIFSILIEVIIFRISRRGSIIDVNKERAYLPTLWMIKLLPLAFVRIMALVAGIATLKIVVSECHHSLMNTTSMSEVCPRYHYAVLLLRGLAWIHILDAISTVIMYVYVGCIVANSVKRRFFRRFLIRNATKTAASSSHGWHWQLLCRCTCTIASLCTCCCFGGREAVFRGDFTDIAIALSDLMDNGTRRRQFHINDNNNGESSERQENRNVSSKNGDIENNTYNELHASPLNNVPLISVTTSDVLAGLLLVAEEQRLQRRQKSQQVYLERQRLHDSVLNNDICNMPEQERIKTKSICVGTLEDHEELEQSENDPLEDDTAINNVMQNNATRNDDKRQLIQSLKLCYSPKVVVDDDGGNPECMNNNDVISPSPSDDGDKRFNGRASEYYYDITERLCLEVDDLSLLQDACHYMRLSCAVYGKLIYLTSGQRVCCCCPCVNLCQATTVYHCRKINAKRNNGGDDNDDSHVMYNPDLIVDGYDCCGCNEVALSETVGQEVHVIYSNFNGSVRMCPYCIVLDHTRKALILVVQGTLSIEAATADLIIRPANIVDTLVHHSSKNDVDDANKHANAAYSSLQGGFCHQGILEFAINIQKDLERHKVLHHLLLGDAPRFPQYKLVCTGHSLGAGVAAMLSILLEPALLARTIEIRCMCFSPPGCVLTKQLAEKDFITSVVVDSDIVPRLSLSSMEALRNDLLEMIARARIPKHEIFYRNFFHTQGDKDLGSSFQMISPSTSDLTSRSGLYDPNSFFHPKTCVNENEFTLQLKRYLDHQNQIKYDRERNVGGEAHLIIPGKRIIHLVKDRTLLFEESRGRRPILRRRSRRESIRRRPRRVKSYTAIWAKSEDFKEIQLSTTFFTDHIPTNVLTRLETVTEALLAATMSEK